MHTMLSWKCDQVHHRPPCDEHNDMFMELQLQTLEEAHESDLNMIGRQM